MTNEPERLEAGDVVMLTEFEPYEGLFVVEHPNNLTMGDDGKCKLVVTVNPVDTEAFAQFILNEEGLAQNYEGFCVAVPRERLELVRKHSETVN